jgi:hypothetical protein
MRAGRAATMAPDDQHHKPAVMAPDGHPRHTDTRASSRRRTATCGPKRAVIHSGGEDGGGAEPVWRSAWRGTPVGLACRRDLYMCGGG